MGIVGRSGDDGGADAFLFVGGAEIVGGMVTVIQRVVEAACHASPGGSVGIMGVGLVLLTAVHATDTDEDVRRTAEKVVSLRCFPEALAGGRAYHLDVGQVGGGILAVPNFTVAADVSGGRRPALHPAMGPEGARGMFEALVRELRARHPRVEQGVFGADMRISLVNEGPFTVVFDSRKG